MKNVVIAGAARTPMGGFQGAFSGVTASELGGAAIKAALEDAGAEASQIEEVAAYSKELHDRGMFVSIYVESSNVEIRKWPFNCASFAAERPLLFNTLGDA